MQIQQIIKQHWDDLLLGQFTSHSIALGLAIGTFIALLPSFGFSALIAFFLIFIFPKINRPAIFFALIVWNPIVQIPIYALSIHLGAILFAGMPVVAYDIEILNQLYSFTRRFLIAHMIITLVLTCSVYAIARYTLRRSL